MILKTEEKIKAIELRKQGMSLRDIVKIVPVAKSTLSLWLKEVKLSKPQKQRLTQKRLDAALRGALKRKAERIAITKFIYQETEKDIGKISQRELWLMGVMLYWAEGAKQKEYNPSCKVQFSNSDPRMIRLFVLWLKQICFISLDHLRFDIYIYESAKKTQRELFDYWSKQIGIPKTSFKGLYFKKGNIKTKRKNIGKGYFGLVSLKVYRSTTLNRKIDGWIKGIEKYYCGIV